MLCHQGIVQSYASHSKAIAFKIFPGLYLYKNCFHFLLFFFPISFLMASSVSQRLLCMHVVAMSHSDRLWVFSGTLSVLVCGKLPTWKSTRRAARCPLVLSKEDGPSVNWDTLRHGGAGFAGIGPLFTSSTERFYDGLAASISWRDSLTCPLLFSLYLMAGIWFMPKKTKLANRGRKVD